MPASLVDLSGMMSFKLDRDEKNKDGKKVYRTVSMYDIDMTKSPDAMNAIAKKLSALFDGAVEHITLTRKSMLMEV